MKNQYYILALALLASPVLLAQAGSLDNTFGSGGIVTTAIGSFDDEANVVVIQPDGKIVVSGFSDNGANLDFAVVRYNTDGSLDISFGSAGKVTTPIGSGQDAGRSVALQQDGKIILAGQSFNGSDMDFALVRYNNDGSLDNTFGSGGKVTTAVSADNDYGYSIAIQPDGKIVVAGVSGVFSNYDFSVVRYNNDGSLDTTFGSGGKIITPIGSGHDFGYSLAIQSDGKIVISGSSVIGPNTDFAMVRYESTGTLDTTFGSGGIVTTAVSPTFDGSQSVFIQPDGKIVAAGISGNGTWNHFALVRYDINGGLDSTFGVGGKVITVISAMNDYCRSVSIQSDGKIVAAGYTLNGSGYDFAVVRYNSDGSLDSAFGSGGLVTTALGSSSYVYLSVTIQPDGKIVVAGQGNNGSNHDFAVVRYLGNGTASETESTFTTPNIQIYPNPARDIVMIQSVYAFENLTVKMMDLSGKVICSQSLGRADQGNIHIANLAGGIYIMEVTDGAGKTSYHRIIKQ
ncbi:MAG TPA: T9SS type A sorting domain-containing protein [Bacteroidia bacterium]|nr:T9SS type A sorting domain-containing protein [Bacteroidia bacterium]